MSSLDALQAPPRSGVTYNTPYMHQVNREYHFSSFVSLSAINQIFSTDFTAGIESIEALNGRGGCLHQRDPVPPALHCLQRLFEAALA